MEEMPSTCILAVTLPSESSGLYLQLVTPMHDEGDGLPFLGSTEIVMKSYHLLVFCRFLFPQNRLKFCRESPIRILKSLVHD